MTQGPIFYTNEDVEIALPFKWEICGCCNGHGTSSAYLGAYTESEMDEAGPDFHDDYMAGVYDRTCDECEGEGKVKVIDRARCGKALLRKYDQQARIDREIDAEQRAEIAAGC